MKAGTLKNTPACLSPVHSLRSTSPQSFPSPVEARACAPLVTRLLLPPSQHALNRPRSGPAAVPTLLGTHPHPPAVLVTPQGTPRAPPGGETPSGCIHLWQGRFPPSSGAQVTPGPPRPPAGTHGRAAAAGRGAGTSARLRGAGGPAPPVPAARAGRTGRRGTGRACVRVSCGNPATSSSALRVSVGWGWGRAGEQPRPPPPPRTAMPQP